MKHDYQVIDADAHVIEPDDLWSRYFDPELAHRAPRHLNLTFTLEVDGHTINTPDGLGTRKYERANRPARRTHLGHVRRDVPERVRARLRRRRRNSVTWTSRASISRSSTRRSASS